jgi:hypothetical protein
MLVIVRGRLLELVSLVLKGQLGSRDPGDFLLTFVGLVVVCAPFQATIRWLVRRYNRATGVDLSYWTAVRAIMLSAWTGTAGPVAAIGPHEALDIDSAPEPVVRALEASFLAIWVVLAVVRSHVTLSSLILVGIFTALMGLSTYCIEQARGRISPSWRRGQSGRMIAIPYSWRLRDYDERGRRWFLGACLISALWFLVFLVLLDRFA